MKKRARLPVVMLAVLFGSIYFSATPLGKAAPVPAPQIAATDSAALSRFAWTLFVQAVAPTGNPNAPLAFENWQEQCELQPQLCGASSVAAVGPSGQRTRRPHASALARLRKGATGGDSSVVGCSPMNAAGFPGIPATNVKANGAVFCEEVFANPPEASFVMSNNLITIAAQQKFGNVTFPWDAVELKVDWVPQSSFVQPFSCTDSSLYIETIQFEGMASQCYAMVGMHLTSKILPNWVWATFEPNNASTNPNRCNGNLYDLCADPWGTTSTAPYGPGKTPAPSAALASLMSAARLSPAFKNYYLTGVQSRFAINGRATQLGNSFVEYNAGVSPHQASCITCHRYAYAGTTSVGGPPNGWPSIGYACNSGQTANCFPPASDKWTSEDFSWMLGIMPAGSGGTPRPVTHK